MLLLDSRQQWLEQVDLANAYRVQPETGLLATAGGDLSKQSGSQALPVFSVAHGTVKQPGRCQQEQ